MKRPIKVLLVDDQVLFREAILMLIAKEPELEIVGEASTGMEAITLAESSRPDVIVMDYSMPGMSGREAARRIMTKQPETKVLILTCIDQDNEMLDCLKVGITGYLMKNIASAQLVEAIKVVAGGETYLQPHIAGRVVAALNHQRLASPADNPIRQHRVHHLSQRETDILRLLSHGKSNKEIAAGLHITEGTVKNHMTSILHKLQVPDRTSAALLAKEVGV
jgi:DNA-binding NarL/FixJ family response regulator